MENKCHFCREEKEIGKEQFWCPRVISHPRERNPHYSIYYYGDWVCLECCSKNFFKNQFSYHLDGICSGSCHDCDFPIGSILKARKMYNSPNPDLKVIRQIRYERDEDFRAKEVITGDYLIQPLVQSGYYGFKWNNNFNCLDLISIPILDGVGELVLQLNKLPIRKVVLLDNTLTYGCLPWGELRRYYWSSCKHEQHFKEEKWMDESPVIITSGYLNKDGLSFDKNTIEQINHIKEDFGDGGIKKELNEEKDDVDDTIKRIEEKEIHNIPEAILTLEELNELFKENTEFQKDLPMIEKCSLKEKFYWIGMSILIFLRIMKVCDCGDIFRSREFKDGECPICFDHNSEIRKIIEEDDKK